MLNNFLFFLFFILIFSSCSQKSTPVADDTCHMTEYAELNTLMHELDMVIYDRFKSELERDNIRRRYALTLADTIKELSLKIKDIDCKKFDHKLSKEEIATYHKYSEELYENSIKIDTIAQRYEFEKLPQELDNLKQICNSCHNVFKVTYE